jgi:hypothetical protein
LAKALAVLAAAAAALVGQQAAAQATAHRQLISMGSANANASAKALPQDALPSARMFSLQAAMTQAYPTIGINADGSDLWPCFGRTTPNGDCPTVGNPVLPLPRGAMVAGVPAYSWALENDDIFGSGLGNGIGCDAFINGTTGLAPAQYKPCGQITTFIEDNTGDSTDEHLQRVIVTQGSNVIFDSGIVDFGPLGPSATYPVVFELYYDANFGFWPGAENGPNNGNCTPDIAYPLAAPAFPGVIYQVAAGSTCSRPVAGKAHVHTTTVLATPSYHQVSGQRCTARNVASPCYTVTWAYKHQIVQDWDVFLR